MHARLALLALGAVLSARAADEKKPVVVAAPDEAVSSARQELDTIKRNAATGTLPQAGLPLMAAPEMGGGPITYAPTFPSDPTKAKTAPSGNWLVEGVLGQQKSDALRDLSTRERALKTKEDEREDVLRQTLATSAGREEEKITGSAPAPADDYGLSGTDPKDSLAAAKVSDLHPDNPLNAFMGSWISHHDLEILSPATPAAPGGAASTPTDPASLDLLVATRSGPGAGPAPPALKDAANPFVDFLNSPVVATPAPEVSYRPVPAPAYLPVPASTAAAPADSRALMPDYAKGMMEDPALKQAKRF